MASAIDDCPVWVLVNLKQGWRSPLEAYTLCLAWYRVSTSREENANGQLYPIGRARVKLHARGARAERETTGVARGGDESEGAHRDRYNLSSTSDPAGPTLTKDL